MLVKTKTSSFVSKQPFVGLIQSCLESTTSSDLYMLAVVLAIP